MYYYVLLLLVLHTMVLLHTTPSGCILGIRYVRTAAALPTPWYYIHSIYYIHTHQVLHTGALLLVYSILWYSILVYYMLLCYCGTTHHGIYYIRYPPYIAYLVVYYTHSIHTCYMPSVEYGVLCMCDIRT